MTTLEYNLAVQSTMEELQLLDWRANISLLMSKVPLEVIKHIIERQSVENWAPQWLSEAQKRLDEYLSVEFETHILSERDELDET